MITQYVACKYCSHFITAKTVKKGDRRKPNSQQVECNASGKSKVKKIITGGSLKCIRFELNPYLPCETYHERVHHKACIKRIKDWTPKGSHEFCTNECEQYTNELIPIHHKFNIKIGRRITRRKKKALRKITRRKKQKRKITRRK